MAHIMSDLAIMVANTKTKFDFFWRQMRINLTIMANIDIGNNSTVTELLYLSFRQPKKLPDTTVTAATATISANEQNNDLTKSAPSDVSRANAS
jgi:hypothetical protein